MLTIEGQIINPVRSRTPSGVRWRDSRQTSNGVNPDKTFRGRIEIDSAGIITRVAEPSGQADILLDDELIFPGFVDLHVHAREDVSHSQDYKEDFASASSAAINGGVVAFMDMPNNPVPPIDDKSYDDKFQLAKKSAVGVVLYAGTGPGIKPLKKLVPYKVYMSQSVGDLFYNSLDEMSLALENYQGQNISFHCEDPEILKSHHSAPTHEQRRPKEAEISAVGFALEMIKKYDLKGKICHLSTKGALEKIIDAKQRGLSVTCEVTPHHLYFDASMPLQVNPPTRSKEDCLALIDGLKNGQIDYLASDHAPHTIQEKAKGPAYRQAGASGLPHLDTFGPFTTWLMREHQFTPQDIARVCSFNPGNFISQFLPHRYGKIEKGFMGSLTVIDINKPITINKAMLKTKVRWSPFEGVEFPGSVKMTVIKGKVYKFSSV